ncbi:hypothetical protein M434DRAFT_400114 [Hypoxylon sp. CO27-5]|nr:hypothetical protein M434DRAFT_400114 [Hypoxylon sp. CO27-5]
MAELDGGMRTPSRWAVLIGVNFYSSSNPKMNLDGCGNDVIAIYNFLRDYLGVPKTNIIVLLALDPNSSTSPTQFLDGLIITPTKANIFAAIDKVVSQAAPGDFVHIHFSGHGDRESTRYPDRKPKHAKDELLCLVDDEDITDVEFGEMLDGLVSPPNSFVVLATLDCCFSGGATRKKDFAIRCKPRLGIQDEIEESISSEDWTPRRLRTAMPVQSWLYRDRDYNALTACQPFETSREGRLSSGEWHGALTSTLMSCLKSLGNERLSTTYGILHGFLDASIRHKLRGVQQPMLFGERNRLLFEPTIIRSMEFQTLAYVTHVEKENIVINRGLVSGSVLGDTYSLKEPGTTNAQTKAAIRVTVTSLDAFSANAQLSQDSQSSDSTHLDNVKVGWLAILISRPRVSYAQILCDPTGPSEGLLSKIQSEWQSFVDPIVQIQLISPEIAEMSTHEEEVKIYVLLDDAGCTMLDSNKKPFENFPVLPKGSPEFTERLMYLLRHLRTYLLVEELKTPQSQISGFQLSIEETDDTGDNQDTVSSWKIYFKNLSSKVLFITVFNLTPLYGIYQVFPSDAGFAIPVESSDVFEEIVDIEIPDRLKTASGEPSFRMTDVIKVFITAEVTDLRHYELPELKNTIPRQLRNVKPRQVKGSSWWIQERKIVTGPSQPQAS